MSTNADSLLPLTEGKTTINNQPAIYVCFNKTCLKPTTSATEVLDQLEKHNTL
jgi:uncharacterized protein